MAKRTYNRRGRRRTTAPVRNDGRGRAQRQKAAEIERRTGSKDRVTRGRGVTRNRTGAPRGAQGPADPPQQGPGRRVPTVMGGDTGRRGNRNQPARSGPPGTGRPPRFDPRVRTVSSLGTILNPRSDLPAKTVAAASLAIDAFNALRNKKQPEPKKKPLASMGKDYKTKEKELARKAAASNFDRAFAKARREGKKTFTWRGKTYNTRLKK